MLRTLKSSCDVFALYLWSYQLLGELDHVQATAINYYKLRRWCCLTGIGRIDMRKTGLKCQAWGSLKCQLGSELGWEEIKLPVQAVLLLPVAAARSVVKDFQTCSRIVIYMWRCRSPRGILVHYGVIINTMVYIPTGNVDNNCLFLSFLKLCFIKIEVMLLSTYRKLV